MKLDIRLDQQLVAAVERPERHGDISAAVANQRVDPRAGLDGVECRLRVSGDRGERKQASGGRGISEAHAWILVPRRRSVSH